MFALQLHSLSLAVPLVWLLALKTVWQVFVSNVPAHDFSCLLRGDLNFIDFLHSGQVIILSCVFSGFLISLHTSSTVSYFSCFTSSTTSSTTSGFASSLTSSFISSIGSGLTSSLIITNYLNCHLYWYTGKKNPSKVYIFVLVENINLIQRHLPTSFMFQFKISFS